MLIFPDHMLQCLDRDNLSCGLTSNEKMPEIKTSTVLSSADGQANW